MAAEPHLTRFTSSDVTLLGDTARPGGVTLAFTERTGGCSPEPYASLNLGSRVGDEPANVEENLRRVLAALGAEHLASRLVRPKQVHGSNVLVVEDGSDEALAGARQAASEGADAIVCTERDVPVLLCFADCVPVVLVAEGGFAVVHSGWRGTLARIASKALGVLVERTGAAPSEVLCYVGPHIGGPDYEVSADLVRTFRDEFGPEVALDDRHLDLGAAVRRALLDAGVAAGHIDDSCPSTASCTERFYSYRAEGGTCGRHGALAVMLGGE
jgi:YfiH family protein